MAESPVPGGVGACGYMPDMKETSSLTPKSKALGPLGVGATFQNDKYKYTGKTYEPSEVITGPLAWLFNEEVVEDVPLRLLKGHCVFSQSYTGDLWLHMKNKHLYLSLFLAHPRHPFSMRLRLMHAIVSWWLAWGVELWYCNIVRPDLCPGSGKSMIWMFFNVYIYKTIICGIGSGLYDASLEQALTCGCVQDGCPRIIRRCCFLLSYFECLLQFVVATIIIIEAFKFLLHIHADNGEFTLDVLITIKELLIGKLFGANVVAFLVEGLAFLLTRRAQMKPPVLNVEARKAWDEPRPPICGLSFMPPRERPSMLWNRFIGDDHEYADLPEKAPSYEIQVKCCRRVVYSEQGDAPVLKE
jgi:hypothetical protein